MKKIISLSVLLLTLSNQIVISQLKNVFTVPYKYIDPVPERYNGNKVLNFSDIKIIDARPDTSKIGFHVRSINLMNVPDIRRLNYKNGLATDVTKYLLNYYKQALTGLGDTIYIVIKKAWISQFDTTLNLGGNLIGSGRIFQTKLKMELYLKNKEYFYPITRVDTSFITSVKRSVNDFGYEITDAIINSLDNLFTLNTSSILQRKKYSLSQVEEFNSRIFDHAILQTTKYKKGIYVTFSEFLNNEPSLNYISINQNKYGDVLYLNDGSGKEYSSNRFWGYCDGENPFIISSKNFFKLVRTQNTFEFYGIKNLRERFDFTSDVIRKRKPALDMLIYQLDIETGETY